MIKKIVLCLLVWLVSINIAAAQRSKAVAPPPPPLLSINISEDPLHARYAVTYTGLNTSPNAHFFVASAVNGTIISYNLNVESDAISDGGDFYVEVAWNKGATAGSITIQEVYSGLSTTYNALLNFPLDEYCNVVKPQKQNLIYGEIPDILVAKNCLSYDNLLVDYQWQEGDVPVGVFPQVPTIWNNALPVAGINPTTFLPSTYLVNSIMAYRLKTTVLHQGNTYIYYSNVSVISIFNNLLAGTISHNSAYNNGVPVINQTPATGGRCDGINYQYSWELSTDQTQWLTIGSNVNYPSNVQIPGLCYIRRRVVCNGETLYSNILKIMPPPLNPGTITGGGTVAFNTLPVVTQTAATGSACNATDYIYTWERSINNGTWLAFGTTGINYPANVPIIGTCKIRRKVRCVYEDVYSNEISFTLLPYTSPNAENKNYVRVNNILIPNVYSWPQADNLPTGDKVQTTTYYDGLGRAIQSVNKEVSELKPNVWGDITNFTEYDAAGRTDKSYLTFPTTSTIGKFKENAKAEQVAYVHNTYTEAATAPTYAQATFENSPFSRVLSVRESGEGWIGKTNSMQYEFNTAAEHIKIWTIDFTETGMPVVTGEYADGKLTKNVSVDDNGKKVYEYTDFSGNTILKKVQLGNTVLDDTHTGWLCTYYVYDDLGQLRSTITPKAVTWLNQYGWAFTNSDIYKELCFYNYFDERGRTVIKHSAGAGEIHLVYDKRDRLVLSQDENQRTRTARQWTFYLYDKENRAIASGLLENTATRAVYQQYASTGMNNDDIALPVYTGQYETIIAHNPVAGNATLGLSYTNLVINAVTYYDNYNYPLAKEFTNNYSFAPTTNTYAAPTVVTSRVLGMSTGSKVRVLDANYNNPGTATQKFLTSTAYFDEKGRTLQALTDNIKGNTDYVVMQYDFSGKILSVCEKQNFPATTPGKFATITQFEYNKIGQTISISKKFYDQPYKKLASYTYDALGRVNEKKLSPDFNNGQGIETLKYDYNLHGLLIGINKDYALSNSSLAQWDHYFGMYLGYDNKDNKFAASRHDGLLTGVLWRAQGDNTPRKYDYDYDNAGRLTAANFTQKEKPTDAAWANIFADFSMTNVSYDENGNLLTMNHRGIIPGNATPIFTDKLAYTYNTAATGVWTNKLERVLDNTTDLTASNNGLLGDFKDEVYGSNTIDYKYDANGNMVVDNNKKIRIGSGNGIEYNFMDKPQKVTIEGKSITEFIYDATGDKLGKKVTNTVSNQITTTWYNGSYVYEEAGSPATVTLQFISNEEGRVKFYTPINQPRVILGNSFDLLDGSGLKGVFEFFVKDNLQNTRAILSEKIHLEHHDCTMETADAGVKGYEEAMFGDKPTGSNQVINTRVNKVNEPPITTAWSVSGTGKTIGNQVAKLTPGAVGPNMLLKVMAGDKLHLKADYFYNAAATNTGVNITNTVASLIGSLLNSGTQGSLGIKQSAGAIYNNLNNLNGAFGQFLQNQNNTNPTGTKAYLNYVFFDENFKFVPYDAVTGLGSSAAEVNTPGNGQALFLPNLKVPKNGYVLVYLSNSSNITVYFDNLDIIHERGRLVEENAYYPYGLKIAGISSKKLGDPNEGSLKNQYQYQGDYSEFDDETQWNEFDLRNYDPQIGRFVQADPYDQFPSPYTGMGNDPINNIDPSGGWSAGLTGMAIGAAVGFAAPYAIEAITGKHIDNKGLWGLGGALLGAGIGYAVAESLSNLHGGVGTRAMDGGFNGSTNFWANFKQFYSGLVGVNSTSWHTGANGYAFATTPDLWGWIPRYEWVVSEILTLKGGVNFVLETSNTGIAKTSSSTTQTNSASVTLDNPKYKRIKFEPEGKSARNITILKNNKPVFKGRLLRGNKKTWRNRFMGRANNFEVQQTVEHTDRAAASGNTLEEVQVSSSPRIVVKMKMRIN
jgi:RHS repeat-associated protein